MACGGKKSGGKKGKGGKGSKYERLWIDKHLNRECKT